MAQAARDDWTRRVGPGSKFDAGLKEQRLHLRNQKVRSPILDHTGGLRGCLLRCDVLDGFGK